MPPLYASLQKPKKGTDNMLTELKQLDKASKDIIEILSNKYLIDFHQDPKIGRPAYPYKWGYNPNWTFDPAHPAEYWSGPTSTGHTLVLLLNTEDVSATRTAVWSEIPELKSHKGPCLNVTNAWSGNNHGCIKDEYSVQLEPHDALVLWVEG
jgi:alpha-galactosidase